MKRIPQVSLAFLLLLNAKKLTFADNVIDLLTKNAASFPDLPFSVVLLKSINDALRQAVKDAANNGTNEKDLLKKLLIQWKNQFKLTAQYVNLVANGDKTVVDLSGFETTQVDVAALGKDNNTSTIEIAIPSGKKGGFVAKTNSKLRKARGYVYFCMPTDATISQTGNMLQIDMGTGKVITIIAQTSGPATFENLTSKVPVNATVFSFNAAGTSIAATLQEVTPQ